MLRDPWTDEERACRSLLTVMGVPTPTAPCTSAARRHRAPRPRPGVSPSSVLGALAAARENARGARETVPAEMWETPEHHLARAWPIGPAAHRRARRALRSSAGCATAARCSAGVADATMSRDEGWLFLVLGRSVERVDMTARLLSTHRRAGGTIPTWLTLLRACGALGDLPAHLPGRAGRPARRRVPAARPAVPALGAGRR